VVRLFDLGGRQLARFAHGGARSGDDPLLASVSTPPALSPDGRRVLTMGPTHVAVWDVASGRLVAVRPTRVSPARGTFVAGGRVLIEGFAEDGDAIWDPDVNEVVSSTLRLAVASSDGRVIAGFTSPDLDRVAIIDPVSGKALREAAVRGERLAISPDGRRLVVLGYDESFLLDTASGERVASLGRLGPFPEADFSADGARILTHWGIDTTARIFDAATGRLVCIYRDAPIVWVTSPGGTTAWDSRTALPLVQVGGDGTCQVVGERLLVCGGDGCRLDDVPSETRPPEEITSLVAARVPLTLSGGRLLPSD
jgi:WD40 repeat protein